MRSRLQLQHAALKSWPIRLSHRESSDVKLIQRLTSAIRVPGTVSERASDQFDDRVRVCIHGLESSTNMRFKKVAVF